MDKLLSCDWGTSTFRLYLFDPRAKKIIAEQSTPNGISRTFELWKRMEEPEENRFDFYWRVLVSHLKNLEVHANISLQHIPILISGMASSSIGMMELPYKNLPFRLDGSDLNYHLLQTTQSERNHELLIISGACSDSDTMRGEETQLVGCDYQDHAKTMFIFPGTHSKHILVNDGMAIECKTFMTGELFALLSEKSILRSSIEANDFFQKENHRRAFESGLNRGLESNILQSLFEVRTNELFHKKNKQENYYFLSGLIIGAEFKEMTQLRPEKIVLVADEFQSMRYSTAFEWLNKCHGLPLPEFKDSVQSILNGQWRIYTHARKEI